MKEVAWSIAIRSRPMAPPSSLTAGPNTRTKPSSPSPAQGVLSTITPSTEAAPTPSRATKKTRVPESPSRVARVRLPTSASAARSRRLLTTSRALAKAPIPMAATQETGGATSKVTRVVPTVATRPKNRKTMTSPRPRYP